MDWTLILRKSPRRDIASLVASPLPDCNDDHDDAIVIDPIDQSKTRLAQLDLVAIAQFAQTRSDDVGMGQVLAQFLFELRLDAGIKFPPVLGRAGEELELIGRQDRRC